MFSLQKWYLDVVGADGRSAIGYSTELRWGPVALGWESLSTHAPGAAPDHRWRVGRASPPSRSAARRDDPFGVVEWRSALLGCTARCTPWTAPFETRLLDSTEGVVDWTCEAAAAAVTFEPAGLSGAGYVECLTLTLPPWQLPITELRWGRWVCAESRRSLVWIDWRGAKPLTLVLRDGAVVPDPVVHEDRVLIGSSSLVLGDTTELHARTLGEALGSDMLVDRLPAPWRTFEDRKWLSVGRLGSDVGWAIHEVVRFPR